MEFILLAVGDSRRAVTALRFLVVASIRFCAHALARSIKNFCAHIAAAGDTGGKCCRWVPNCAIGCASAAMMHFRSCAWVHSDQHAMHTLFLRQGSEHIIHVDKSPSCKRSCRCPSTENLCIPGAVENKHRIQSAGLANEQWIVPLATLDRLPVVSNPSSTKQSVVGLCLWHATNSGNARHSLNPFAYLGFRKETRMQRQTANHKSLERIPLTL